MALQPAGRTKLRLSHLYLKGRLISRTLVVQGLIMSVRFG
jgi:hypothetical protein